jgi:hypothetical protein
MPNDMSEQMKAAIIMQSVDALFNHGLPALVKLVNAFGKKEALTSEDIDAIGKDMKRSEEYFK